MKSKCILRAYARRDIYCREHATYCWMKTGCTTNQSGQLNVHSEVSESRSETQKHYFIGPNSAFLARQYLWIRLPALAHNTGPPKAASAGLSWVFPQISHTLVSRSCKSQNRRFSPHCFALVGFFLLSPSLCLFFFSFFYLKETHVALLRKAERLQQPSN